MQKSELNRLDGQPEEPIIDGDARPDQLDLDKERADKKRKASKLRDRSENKDTSMQEDQSGGKLSPNRSGDSNSADDFRDA